MAQLDLDKIVGSSSITATVLSAATHNDTKDWYVNSAIVDFEARFLDNEWTTIGTELGTSLWLILPNTTGRASEISSLVNSVDLTLGDSTIYTKLNKTMKKAKVSDLGLTLPASSVVIDKIREMYAWNRPHGIAIEWWYAYVACYGSNRVDKINLSTFTNVGNVAVWTNPYGIAIEWWYAYVVCSGSNRVDKINLSTFTNVGNVATWTNPYGIAIEWWYAYVYCYDSSRVDKINLSTFTNVGNLPLLAKQPTAIFNYNSKRYVWYWDMLYNLEDYYSVSIWATIKDMVILPLTHTGWEALYCLTSDNKLQKRDVLDFGLVNEITTNINDASWIAFDDGYLYIINRWANNVLKIDLSTFTIATTIALTSANSIQQWVVDSWVLYITSKGNWNVIKYNLATETETTLNIANWPEWILSDWTYLYVMWSSWANVIKINISTFTNVANVTVWATPLRGTISWTTLFTVNTGSVTKIDLWTFTTIWTQVIWTTNFDITSDDDYLYISSFWDYTIYRLTQEWEWENYVYLNDIEVYRRFGWRGTVSDGIANTDWVDVNSDALELKYSCWTNWVTGSWCKIKWIF